ncbi:MAG TPA: type IV toxin-antitoxin system AbiEi family antitoxin domain-containing protein [Solirubrobacterales bacterium]|jgi:predicted transcriptional regulator of viral defense system/very-short-patch-repair endonuclease
MWDKRRTHRGTGLAETAQRQHGVVSARQLAELGFPRETIARWVKEQRLHRLQRGVYAVGHRALTWEGHCMAAVLGARPAVASHKTAAWIWELRRWRPEAIHLTAPTRRHRRGPVVVHFALLEPEDLDVIDGIPVTSVARTMLDLAPEETTRRLHQMIDRAEERKTFDLRRFDSLLARAGGHPGRVKLRYALDTFKPEQTVLRSDLERRFRDLVIAAGLPAPQTNVVVEAYELDAYWEAEGFAVELDVFATHGSRLSFETDREREDDLLLAGIELIRVTGTRLDREPRETIARVAAHLERRRRTIGPRRSVA